jgi:hypothetical protein
MLDGVSVITMKEGQVTDSNEQTLQMATLSRGSTAIVDLKLDRVSVSENEEESI